MNGKDRDTKDEHEELFTSYFRGETNKSTYAKKAKRQKNFSWIMELVILAERKGIVTTPTTYFTREVCKFGKYNR